MCNPSSTFLPRHMFLHCWPRIWCTWFASQLVRTWNLPRCHNKLHIHLVHRCTGRNHQCPPPWCHQFNPPMGLLVWKSCCVGALWWGTTCRAHVNTLHCIQLLLCTIGVRIVRSHPPSSWVTPHKMVWLVMPLKWIIKVKSSSTWHTLGAPQIKSTCLPTPHLSPHSKQFSLWH